MSTRPFDPASVAYYEVEGWKAYYDRNWLRLLWLVVALVQAQFRIPFPQSIRAAYHVTRASVAWVPKEHKPAEIQHHLSEFYRLARRYSGLDFDVERAAELELDYWDVHRQLVRQADKTRFINTMTKLHAVVFSLPESAAQESAMLRVEANNVLDTITGKTSPNPEHDWKRCELLLVACYQSIRQHADAVQRQANLGL
ncbi:MAG: hypothetical protein J0M07_22260 [Anaerolineae bacterium]|nr:hypothetical protein [Anaerolineae bacterium]